MAGRLVLKASRPAKKQAVRKTKKVHPDREKQFSLIWMHLAKEFLKKNPQFRIEWVAPVPQHRFHDERKWRFDFAFTGYMVAVEIDGGIFQAKGTGHRSISGVMADIEKHNEAQIKGWIVLRFHAKDLDNNPEQVCATVIRGLIERSNEARFRGLKRSSR